MPKTNFKKILIWNFCLHVGTDEERGLIKWNDQFKSKNSENEDSDVTNDTYGMPFGMGIIKR